VASRFVEGNVAFEDAGFARIASDIAELSGVPDCLDRQSGRFRVRVGVGVDLHGTLAKSLLSEARGLYYYITHKYTGSAKPTIYWFLKNDCTT
jgi:hypothetical protein